MCCGTIQVAFGSLWPNLVSDIFCLSNVAFLHEHNFCSFGAMWCVFDRVYLDDRFGRATLSAANEEYDFG